MPYQRPNGLRTWSDSFPFSIFNLLHGPARCRAYPTSGCRGPLSGVVPLRATRFHHRCRTDTFGIGTPRFRFWETGRDPQDQKPKAQIRSLWVIRSPLLPVGSSSRARSSSYSIVLRGVRIRGVFRQKVACCPIRVSLLPHTGWKQAKLFRVSISCSLGCPTRRK